MTKIKINDKEYPCKVTFGAYSDFEEETGKNIGQINGISDSFRCVFYAIRRECRKANIDFEWTFDEFCEMFTLEEVSMIINEVFGSQKEEGQEKKR